VDNGADWGDTDLGLLVKNTFERLDLRKRTLGRLTSWRAR
jgi:hypothetical protein